MSTFININDNLSGYIVIHEHKDIKYKHLNRNSPSTLETKFDAGLNFVFYTIPYVIWITYTYNYFDIWWRGARLSKNYSTWRGSGLPVTLFCPRPETKGLQFPVPPGTHYSVMHIFWSMTIMVELNSCSSPVRASSKIREIFCHLIY